jgi:diaminohydroxyphosphoribosylaminopyrimidine deaminase/5-amino-6-(5-phosphoribosylamino)uracil reductase
MKDKLWLKLLELKTRIDAHEGEIAFCHIVLGGEVTLNQQQHFRPKMRSILILTGQQTDIDEQDSTVLVLKDPCEVLIKKKGQLKNKHLKFLQIYLPYCLMKLHAIKFGRSLAVAHFAQTLDGKIATATGDSKWIGNEENLIHAHRMRALCDAIMVGSGTVKFDKPKLTVRMVPGKNPHRVVIGNSCEDFHSLLEACPDEVTVLGSIDCTFPEGVNYFKLETNGDHIAAETILQFLFSRGIYSVYLEGGPLTTSNFLKDKKVDILQLHLAPMLFGSGKQAIKLPHIEQVTDGVQFENFRFWKMGDAIMFGGCLV